MTFGADGALYVSSGEGASFDNVDYGQLGGTLPSTASPLVPRNVCGDPPGGVGGAMAPPTAQGGALRSQSLRRALGPVVLNGTILRVNPDTGAALPDNPLAASPDDNAKRVVGYGLRNPFRITTRPGTSEIWIGDVGYGSWEEVNRIVDPLAAPQNFGWPCYEGGGRQGGYDGTNLDLCETLYSAGTAVSPHHSYGHVGSSSIAGLAFYDTGNYPVSYQGALFFTDYNRRVVFVMPKDGTGVPGSSLVTTFASGLNGGAVDLVRGPAGDIVYVDYDGGRVQRITYGGPSAIATATPTSGAVPLLVQFDGSASTGTALTYAWDLDGDGQFDDSTAASPTWTYATPGNYVIRLRVLDGAGMASTSPPLAIAAGNTAPTATIATPLAHPHLQGGGRDRVLGLGHRPAGRSARGRPPHLAAHPSALPLELPRAHGAGLRRGRERVVRRARPRVPVLPRAAPHRDRLERAHRSRECQPRAAHRAPELRDEPRGPPAFGEPHFGRGALLAKSHRGLQQLRLGAGDPDPRRPDLHLPLLVGFRGRRAPDHGPRERRHLPGRLPDLLPVLHPPAVSPLRHAHAQAPRSLPAPTASSP